jgi:transposase-like protein
MPRRPDPGKQQRWLDLVRRWQRSGRTVRDFCQCHGISEPRFYAWRRALRQRGLIHDSLSSEPVVAPASAFVKLMVQADPSAASAVELVLGERRLLRVRPGFDADTLRQLVRLLEGPAC